MQRNIDDNDKAMMVGVSIVQQMVAFTMNINSSVEVRQKLMDKLERPLNSLTKLNTEEEIKATLISRLGFEEEVAEKFAPKILEIKRNNSLNASEKKKAFYDLTIEDENHKTISITDGYPDLAKEIKKMNPYQKDAEIFNGMLKEFFNNLPSDPEKAWKVIHYCSMRLNSECKTLDETLSFADTSSNPQKCALLMNFIQSHIEEKLRDSVDKEQFKFWCAIYQQAKDDKDMPMICGIDSALRLAAIDEKLTKFKLNKKFQDYRNSTDSEKQEAQKKKKDPAYIKPQGKMLRNDAKYVLEEFKPVPAGVNLFGSTLALEVESKLEVAVTSHKALTQAYALYADMDLKVKVEFEKVIKSLPDIIKNNLEENINSEFIRDKFDTQKNELMKLGYTEMDSIDVLIKFLEAIKAAKFYQKPDFKNETFDIKEAIKKQIDTRSQEINAINVKKDNLVIQHRDNRDVTLNEIKNIFNDNNLLSAIHTIGVEQDKVKKLKIMQSVSQTYDLSQVMPYLMYTTPQKVITLDEAKTRKSSTSSSNDSDSPQVQRKDTSGSSVFTRSTRKDSSSPVTPKVMLGARKGSGSTSSSPEKMSLDEMSSDSTKESREEKNPNTAIESHKEGLLTAVHALEKDSNEIENYNNLKELANIILDHIYELNYPKDNPHPLKVPLTIVVGAIEQEAYKHALEQLNVIKNILTQQPNLSPEIKEIKPRQNSGSQESTEMKPSTAGITQSLQQRSRVGITPPMRHREPGNQLPTSSASRSNTPTVRSQPAWMENKRERNISGELEQKKDNIQQGNQLQSFGITAQQGQSITTSKLNTNTQSQDQENTGTKVKEEIRRSPTNK